MTPAAARMDGAASIVDANPFRCSKRLPVNPWKTRVRQAQPDLRFWMLPQSMTQFKSSPALRQTRFRFPQRENHHAPKIRATLMCPKNSDLARICDSSISFRAILGQKRNKQAGNCRFGVLKVIFSILGADFAKTKVWRVLAQIRNNWTCLKMLNPARFIRIRLELRANLGQVGYKGSDTRQHPFGITIIPF